LPAHRQRRQANSLFQHFLRRFGVAFGDQHIGHAIVEGRHHREDFQGFFVNALGLADLTALEQQLAQSGKRPGQRSIRNDAVVKTLQRFVLVQVAQRIGAVTQAQRRITNVLFAQGDAGIEHFNRFAPVKGLQDRFEQGLALFQSLQALGQAGTVERLGQVSIGLMLQCAEHHGLAGFGGDHDKHTFMADQLLDHQVFEYLLTVLLAIAQVEILQDEVVGLLRAHAQRLFTGIGGVDVLDAQLP